MRVAHVFWFTVLDIVNLSLFRYIKQGVDIDNVLMLICGVLHRGSSPST
jgi:hypothetical protein